MTITIETLPACAGVSLADFLVLALFAQWEANDPVTSPNDLAERKQEGDEIMENIYWARDIERMIDIIAETKERLLKTPYTDMSKRDLLSPPIDEEQITIMEKALGFKLPDTLRQLYMNVADGVFGPGFGIAGSPRHASTQGTISYISLVEEYFMLRLTKPEPNEQQWPEGLLPLCEWGCSIKSSVLCTVPNFPVIRNDPNRYYKEIIPYISSDRRIDEFARVYNCSWIESPSFDQWFSDWLRGVKLFNVSYRDPL